MKSLLGQQLNGRYSIVRQLQQKSSHITYLAEDREKLGYGQCLVKQFTLDIPHNTSNWHAGDRFKQFLVAQIKRVSQFNEQPKIPPVLDYFLWGNELCSIRKFIVGKTLAEEIAYRPLEESEVVYFLRETLTALEVIHRAGEMHLNLKPANIIFATISQKIFVTDFDRLEYLLRDKIVKSPIREAIASDDYYIAPEQKIGKPQFSSDFYALGVVAIKALTGKYTHEIRFENLDNYARASLVDIATTQTTYISSQLAKVLHNLVSTNPESRYQSSQAIIQALKQPENVVVLPSLEENHALFARKNQLLKIDRANKKSTSNKLRTRTKLLIIAVLAIIGTIAYSLIIKSDRFQFAEYRNENYGIALKYPEDWTVEELEDPITGEIAVIVSPLENASDSFQEKIYLSIDNYALNREEYGRYLLDRIQDAANIMNVTYDRDSTSADRSTQSIIYQRKQGNIDLQQKETFTFKNGKVYSLTYVAQKDKYQKFIDTVNKVMKSFTIDS